MIVTGGMMVLIFVGTTLFSGIYSLNGIKNKAVGDGQYGIPRFATEKEISQCFTKIKYERTVWRRGLNLPEAQGLIVGCQTKGSMTMAFVDTDESLTHLKFGMLNRWNRFHSSQ